MISVDQLSIHAWIQQHGIRTGTGIPLDFKDHGYMFDVYRDFSPYQCGMKAAQVTYSTCMSIKSLYLAKNLGIDIIYTFPTESDRNMFVGGQVNRIIANNPVLQRWTKDKDSVEQKRVGNNLVHFRGTFTQKAAIMIPSDLNIYDEVDASKQDVIEQYSTRLQHSKYKWEWYFSHPSASGFGVDRFWAQSDQKHWFIKCPKCNKEQYLSFPESVCEERQVYQCKECHAEINDDARRHGRWVKKKSATEQKFSGYWIPLLICPFVSARSVLDYHKTKTEEYFFNKVLGLPYIGGGNKLTWEMLKGCLTGKDATPPARDEPIVIGIDTGLAIDYVMGNEKGLFYHGETKDYDELDEQMLRWSKAIAVIDAGGDLIGSRKFQERWRGRVFLCYTGGDRKTTELAKFGTKDEEWNVVADRNRMIQLVVDEFRDRRVPVQGTEKDWYDYWLDWNNLTRTKVIDPQTLESKGFKWIRSGRDHRALATVYWRVGMMRFGYGGGTIIGEPLTVGVPVSAEVRPDETMQHLTEEGKDPIAETLQKMREGADDDWRNY